tara:strand:+ start:3598 stop:4197 length:600 start_codon:yes stop_codon:yes gene_type:complete
MTTSTKQVQEFQKLLANTFSQEVTVAGSVNELIHMADELKLPDTHFISPNLPEGKIKNDKRNTDAAFYRDSVQAMIDSLPDDDRVLVMECKDNANKDIHTGVDWKRGKKLLSDVYSYMGTTRGRLINKRAGLTQTGNKKKAPQTPTGEAAVLVDEKELMLKARKRVEDLNKYLTTNMSEDISSKANPLLVKVLALLINH